VNYSFKSFPKAELDIQQEKNSVIYSIYRPCSIWKSSFILK